MERRPFVFGLSDADFYMVKFKNLSLTCSEISPKNLPSPRWEGAGGEI